MVATGQFAKPKEKLAEMLRDLTQTQSFLGVSSAAEANERIHRPEARDGVDDGNNPLDPRPRIVIQQGPVLSREKQGVQLFVTTEGSLFASFERDAEDPDDLKASLDAFESEVGAILEAAEAVAGLGDAGGGESYLNMTGWGLVDGPGTSDPEEEDGEIFHGVTVLVSWA